MIFSRLPASTLALALLAGNVLAQDYSLTGGYYVDAPTGINFSAWSTQPQDGGKAKFTYGFALPGDALTKNATEYIGLLQCQSFNASMTGWCGIAHGGHMTKDLLLMAWPYKDHVYTSFRYVDDYFLPPQFGGVNGTNGTSAVFPAPKLSIISTKTNATGFEVIYRCQNCWSWQQGTYNESVSTAGDPTNTLVLGFAQAAKGPVNPGCPGNSLTFGFHDNGYSQWGAPVANATRTTYASWAKLATAAPNAGANLTAANCNVPAQPKPSSTATPEAKRTVKLY